MGRRKEDPPPIHPLLARINLGLALCEIPLEEQAGKPRKNTLDYLLDMYLKPGQSPEMKETIFNEIRSMKPEL